MQAQPQMSQKSAKEKATEKHEVKPLAAQGVLIPESALPLLDLQRAAADPRTARPPEILALQRQYGNDAVQRKLADHNLQPKLTVGAANDAYEQEADRMAAQVMSTPARTPDVQRQEEEWVTQPLPSCLNRRWIYP